MPYPETIVWKLKFYCSDPYVRNKEIISSQSLINKSDIIVVATPHLKYKKIRLPKNKIIIDVWGITKKK